MWNQKTVVEKKKTGRIRLNYIGHSFETRLLFAGAPERIYYNNDQVLHELLKKYADQVMDLGTRGFEVADGSTMYIADLGTLGDWPALICAGRLKRSFRNVQKRPVSNFCGKGICHICLGGKGKIKWEEMGGSA